MQFVTLQILKRVQITPKHVCLDSQKAHAFSIETMDQSCQQSGLSSTWATKNQCGGIFGLLNTRQQLLELGPLSVCPSARGKESAAIWFALRLGLLTS